MNSYKRSHNEVFDWNRKKLRITFDEDNLPTTRFEHLSNELFYEIFEYLDACDIYKAFSNLNIRFQNILTRSFQPLKVKFNQKSVSTLEHCCRHVIIPNRHRIISLHFDNFFITDSFFNYCSIDASFNRLESIVLNDISDSSLFVVLFYLKSLPRLSSLIIALEQDYSDLNNIYRLVFCLLSLKYFKLSLSLEYDETDIQIPISINVKFSTIDRLVIDHYCNLYGLISILHHTPHLRYLTCAQLIDPEEHDGKKVPLILTNLIYASFTCCHLSFDVFEEFIKKICSQLKTLRLETLFDSAYLNGNRWKQLIRKHIPHLHQFHFDHHADKIYDDTRVPNYETIKQFTSDFWIERKWFFQLNEDRYEDVYSIHSNQKYWFDHYEREQTGTCVDRITNQYSTDLDNTSREYDGDKLVVSSIQLTVSGYSSDNWNLSYISGLKLSPIAEKFTYLNIDCNSIPIGMLIEIIRLLVNLNSLKVSSLPIAQLNCLPAEDAEMLLFVSITNKITKVKLTKMNDMEQVNFLMNICCRMKYFEVECTTMDQLENIVGSVSMNSMTRVPYVRYLALCIPNITENMIERLNEIIEFERLFYVERTFRDYQIRRIENKIFVTWNLGY